MNEIVIKQQRNRTLFMSKHVAQHGLELLSIQLNDVNG